MGTRDAWAKYFAAPLALIAVLLGGCVATNPAPVSERPLQGRPAPAAASKPEIAAVAKPEAPAAPKPDAGVVVTPLTPSMGPAYTVKPGDTLFSIARANNVPMRDLAAWNNIDVPYVITVGQALRLTPPDGVALAPVKPSGAVETAPLGATGGTPPGADSSIKTQPLGQRMPYSEQAYAQMSKGPAAAKAETKTEPKPEIRAEPKAEPKAETKAETKAEAKAETPPDTKPDKPRTDGELNWAWPTQGKVVRNFNEGSNKGIAIAGSRGQPVHASAAGRVIFSGSGIRGLGNLVVIRHNINYLSVYAHNDKLLVKQGQNVTKGQHIADMGNSDADQVKLHFEIRRQGKPVDPIRLLPAM
jgi:lipoprotein NlpD